MKLFKFCLPFFLILSFICALGAQEIPVPVKTDTSTLAQAYINLYLTETYFDSLPSARIKKILAFENDELKSINDRTFIRVNSTLYNFTNALFYQNQSKFYFHEQGEITRSFLRRLKSNLGRGISYYNAAKIDQFGTFQKERSMLYEMIKFDSESNNELNSEIRSLKSKFNTLFNEDIFPDFKRVFLAAKNSDSFYLDSLSYFSNIYDMPLSREILRNTPDFKPFSFENSNFIKPEYIADSRLDIISRYIQLKYLASKKTRVSRNFNKTFLYDAYDDFIRQVRMENDQFIREELNSRVCKMLLNELTSKFPRDKELDEMANAMPPMAMVNLPPTNMQNYFFPNPAPLGSAKLIISNYKPSLSTLGQVDSFLSTNFNGAGFKNELHYYYAMDGFALTTTLEKFNKDGSAVPIERRFIKNLGGEGKFSFYETFKSMFFNIESEYRMFALIIASKSAAISNEGMSAGFAGQILENSYDALPVDLKTKNLPIKTLSVFVYHFHQNDIGEVPELDLSGSLTVSDHLKSAGLSQIIQ
ncbi:hypothetical protein LV84_00046 [Algoriphagus ratkowskyi]|uniref:Uncharacterized protein n=1 Tax=Algoriphagus ratkowskyi TaxID=57028 RepID=A0A2W7RJL8_9BACT|nr:hypothetical protein [Algoriphagus ratkowskyi]PZX61058.1 hypothetical protein LV84_00046 [Algoriphagus ratkowskyi]TXD79194.1 hypothetical protein ESW18_02860 [Algoriphagus ratkowskyi]